MSNLLTLILVGFSVGLSNFAAAIAIGLSGVNRTLRIKLALTFGIFESLMPLIGLILGKELAHKLNGNAPLIGGGLLILTGIYVFISHLRESRKTDVKKPPQDLTKLIITALALSIDNLIIGFSLGTNNEPLLASAIVIGATSVALSLIGLEIGNKLSVKTEKYSELLSGIILTLVGLAILTKIL